MGLLGRGARPERTGTPADLLVIGLGNPGAEHAGTRHNLGVEVVEELARRGGTSLKRGKEKALTAEVTLAGKRFALAFPQTYVNLSGESAVLLVRRFGIDHADQIVVVHDELDLAPGQLRVKVGGGLAGHNGLRSLHQHLHTADFVRVRIGIGKPPGRQDGASHVLRKVGKAERAEFDVVVREAADAVELIASAGAASAMTAVNAR